MKLFKNIFLILALTLPAWQVSASVQASRIHQLKNTLASVWHNKKVKAVVAGCGALTILGVAYLAHKRHQHNMLPFTQYPVAQERMKQFKKSGVVKIRKLPGLSESNYTTQAYFGTLSGSAQSHIQFLIQRNVLVLGWNAAADYKINDTGMMLNYIEWVKKGWNITEDVSDIQKELNTQEAQDLAQALENLLVPLFLKSA